MPIETVFYSITLFYSKSLVLISQVTDYFYAAKLPCIFSCLNSLNCDPKSNGFTFKMCLERWVKYASLLLSILLFTTVVHLSEKIQFVWNHLKSRVLECTVTFFKELLTLVKMKSWWYGICLGYEETPFNSPVLINR